MKEPKTHPQPSTDVDLRMNPSNESRKISKKESDGTRFSNLSHAHAPLNPSITTSTTAHLHNSVQGAANIINHPNNNNNVTTPSTTITSPNKTPGNNRDNRDNRDLQYNTINSNKLDYNSRSDNKLAMQLRNARLERDQRNKTPTTPKRKNMQSIRDQFNNDQK